MDNLMIFRTRTVALTTHRKDGTPVTTPVNVALAGDHGVIKTWSTSGKAKRIRRDATAYLTPCTFRGKLTGDPVRVTARLIDGHAAIKAAKLLRAKHPFMHGLFVPIGHRIRRMNPVYIEVVLVYDALRVE